MRKRNESIILWVYEWVGVLKNRKMDIFFFSGKEDQDWKPEAAREQQVDCLKQFCGGTQLTITIQLNSGSNLAQIPISWYSEKSVSVVTPEF